MARARRGSPLRLTPSFDLFRPSYELVRKNIWIFGTLYFVPIIFWVHSWIWTSPNTANPAWFNRFYGHSTLSASWGSSPFSNLPDTFVGFSIIWFLIIIIGGTIAQLMAVIATYEASPDKVIAINRLWATTKEIGWRLIGLYIVTGLIIFVGFILLIIPGLIMLRRYFLAPYVMMDKNCGIREAMDRSAAISKPHSGYIWGIIGVTILISMVGIIPLIGSIVAFTMGMFYSVAPALRYQELKKLN
jgi:hypothetical protein